MASRKVLSTQISAFLATEFTLPQQHAGTASIHSALQSLCWRNRIMDQFGARLGAVTAWMWSLAIVLALVVSVAVPRTFAQSREDIDERCQRRIEHADHELHE